MNRLRRAVEAFLAEERGASVVEYALTLLLITAVTLLGIGVLGTALSNFFVSAAGSL